MLQTVYSAASADYSTRFDHASRSYRTSPSVFSDALSEGSSGKEKGRWVDLLVSMMFIVSIALFL